MKVRRLRRILLFASAPFVAAGALCLFEVARLPDVDQLLRAAPVSTVLLDREGNPIRYAPASSGDLAPRVPLAKIEPLLVRATIAAEDARFYRHGGVDLLAACRALWLNVTRGRIVSGASTITMQLARLLRPLPRSYYGKFREALLAIHLERKLGKEEILELYLNLAPYGGNARGVEAAARRWFGRAPDDLSLSEAALLAALPQSPGRLRPDRHPERARARRDWILDRMESLKMVETGAAREAGASAVQVSWNPLPLSAAHFGSWALARVAPGSRVRTTLDPALQAMAEEAVRARLRDLSPLGVEEGSALVVETASGRIRAMVGSGDFTSPRGGQVNGAAAPRSPGSLLKPFLYALAFERGIIAPDTVLEDSPRRFRDGYDPRNFSGGFAGRLPAREALARSLNVPAVEVLERVGVRPALERMRAFGLRGLRRAEGRSGLSLALGGVEVTLLELVEAYAALARLGEHLPLSFREDGPPAVAGRVLSPRAAYDVACALEGTAFGADEREGGLNLPRMALKTGTSHGFRDAWAIAYTPRYTVGVWFGNFNSRSSPALIGQSAAAPAALELMRRLEPGGGEWFAPPPEAISGPLLPPPREVSRRPSARGLRWLLPDDGAVYFRHGREGGDRLPLSAEFDRGGKLTFFVDGGFVGRCGSGEVLNWPLRPGPHRVTLVAPGGRSEVRTIRVEER
jgi:penicillin-binding protein 1C